MTAFSTARAGTGEWIGVLGERTLVVLPPGAASTAAQVWIALDAGEGFDGVLDVVVADGLSQVPSFLIGEISASGAIRLLLRGVPEARVHLADGTTGVIDSGHGLWHDEVVLEVVGLEVDLGTGAWADAAFTSGLRRLGSFSWGSAALDSPVLAPAEAAPRQEPASSFVGDETAPLAAVPPVPAPASPVPVVDAGDAVTDVLAAVAPAPAAPAAPPAPPAPVAPEAHTTVQPVAKVSFSHGLVIVLDAPCVVGRAPSPVASAFPEARTVSVPSPLGEVSSSHLELFPGVGPQAGLVLVVDLGSTNGTVVRRVGRPPVALVPGAPWVLEPGTTVDLGDGATLRTAPL